MVLNRKVLYLQPKLGYRKQIYIYEEHLDLQVRRFGSCWEFLHFRSSLKVSPLGIIGFKPTSRRFFQCIILVKIILNFYYKEISLACQFKYISYGLFLKGQTAFVIVLLIFWHFEGMLFDCLSEVQDLYYITFIRSFFFQRLFHRPRGQIFVEGFKHWDYF